MDDLVRDFVAETREGIDALDSGLLHLEQNPKDKRTLGEIFRLMHTIKGTCGFIGLPRLQAIAHSGEAVFDAFRAGSAEVTPEAVTAVLEVVDLIRMIIDQLSSSGSEPQGDDAELIHRLEGFAEARPRAPEPTPTPPPVAEPQGPLVNRIGGDASIDAACEMAVARTADGLSEDDALRLQGILCEGLIGLARGNSDPELFDLQLKAALSAPPTPEHLGGLFNAVGQALRDLESESDAVDQLIADARRTFGAAVPHSAPAPAVPQVSATAGVTSSPGPAPAAPAAPVAAPADVVASEADKTIRVGVDALEHLMTVVSELVLIRNQLLQILRLEPESPFAAPLHRLNQVTSELQEGVMTTRMQPISGAWAKLPRLVRDLSRDLNKSIDLQMLGQDTELDRQVLELIKDPLTHMVRNAADHGLEGPEERAAAGKPATGRIVLAARHEGGAIVIELSDDGKGLSHDKIRDKATSQGLINAVQADAMSQAELLQLIFLPGFSTAQTVTAVSGRGVGMDVVRTNIERIGGVIELHSEQGRGTRFTIRIPLTLTIISALIVECCGERFAMPQTSVVELVSPEGSGHAIEYLDGAPVYRLRDRLLPLISLQAALGLRAQDEVRREETCIVVARVGTFSFGVIVDRVFDTEEIVVKPVSTVLRHLKVYSGATILGDGSVVMILDFKGLSGEVASPASAGGGLVEEALSQAGTGGRTSDILVFRGLDDALKAVPLSAVARIEETDCAAIEHVKGDSVLQYLGRLIPVVDLDGGPVTAPQGAGVLPLLVFTRGEQTLGVLTREVVDIVEAAPTTDLNSGRLIISGHATEMIDIEGLWPKPTSIARAATTTVQATVASSKQVLVIDPSPFTQLLLRPLLAQAGYQVTVSASPGEAMALHERGEMFDLVMADLSGEGQRAFAKAFQEASAWRDTPLMSLQSGDWSNPLEAKAVAAAVAGALEDEPELRGAA